MKKTKAWNHSMTCLISGYRQVTIRTTSTEWSTPKEREPSVCLSSCVEYWRYSKWENKSQKLSISIQYLNDMFYIKLLERKRRLGFWGKASFSLGDVGLWLQHPGAFLSSLGCLFRVFGFGVLHGILSVCHCWQQEWIRVPAWCRCGMIVAFSENILWPYRVPMLQK